MPVLSQPDATVPIACTLPANEFADRLRALGSMVGHGLEDVTREPGSIRIRVGRRGRADLEVRLAEWSRAEKACCAFLGFAVDADGDAVTVRIDAPPDADRTLDAIDWLVRAAGRPGATA